MCICMYTQACCNFETAQFESHNLRLHAVKGYTLINQGEQADRSSHRPMTVLANVKCISSSKNRGFRLYTFININVCIQYVYGQVDATTPRQARLHHRSTRHSRTLLAEHTLAVDTASYRFLFSSSFLLQSPWNQPFFPCIRIHVPVPVPALARSFTFSVLFVNLECQYFSTNFFCKYCSPSVGIYDCQLLFISSHRTHHVCMYVCTYVYCFLFRVYVADQRYTGRQE